MVRLVYSNRTEELLAELAARVRAQQARDGALAPVRVIVPSASIEGYLRLGVARVQGVAANLEFSRLTGFAADVVRAASGAQVADAGAIEAMALRLLLDTSAAGLGHDDLAPVRAYLAGGGDAPDPMDVRRVQLATRIGRLFEEYTYSRGEMLSAWRRDAVLGVETERWQRRLWLAMFGEGGLAERAAMAGGARVVPLHEAVAALDPRTSGLTRAAHVFGFAHVARGFLELVERVAGGADVVLYALSPCEGFWEDADPADPLPLQLWGRPGREQVRVLNAIARFDHDDRFVDPRDDARPPTLLRRLQSDVLHRERPGPASPVSPSSSSSAPDDESLVVLEHASVRREVEAVASEIWRRVEADPTLRFDDVAVLVPEGESTYGAQVSAVFREAHDLPHRAAGQARGGGVVEAIELLLALPLGKFTRQDLLRLVLHPAVLGTMDEVDPVRWAAWCDALGVVHGADRSDHAETYIERDVFNWDQGLRRLALGVFMTGDASGEPRPVEWAGQSYVPCEVAGGELHDAASFGVLVRSLVADMRFARDGELTMAEWASFLRKVVETYVAPAGAADEEQLARCLRRLHTLAAIDLGGARVRYRVAAELARQRVGAMPGGPTGEGVVVTTLAALRSVPFRVVFACGMGEGQFPSAEAEDPLDLRWVRRREGDVTARERDKYGFLELLLGVRDRLYLSYVAREPLTGETLAPSSVVEELLHAVERGYGIDLPSLRRRHPLRRWDPDYFPAIFRGPQASPSPLGTMRLAEARAEARTLALRQGHARASSVRLAPEDVLRARGADPAWRELAEQLGLVHLADFAPAAEGRTSNVLSVPLYAILKFLEFPLQGWARFRVGLDEVDDDDPTTREDEPFETDARREVLFLREVLLDAAARGCPIEQAYDEAVRGRELRGSGPSGLFARGERGPHLATLDAWCAELESARRVRGRPRGRPLRARRGARARGEGVRRAGARSRGGRPGGRAPAEARGGRRADAADGRGRGLLGHAREAAQGDVGQRVGRRRARSRRAARVRGPRDAERVGRGARPAARVGAGRAHAGGQAAERPGEARAAVARRGDRVAARRRARAARGAARVLPPVRGGLRAPGGRPRRARGRDNREGARHARRQGRAAGAPLGLRPGAAPAGLLRARRRARAEPHRVAVRRVLPQDGARAVTRVARPAVLRQVPLDRHVVIDASAGTGKTFTLESLVVELVLSTDMTLDQLLCVTFTEKATHEIRSRVRAKLETLLAGRGEPATDEQVRAGDYWTIDARAIERLQGALHAFDSATIATIHAFCHRVLRENAFASGRCFEEKQVDGREAFGRAFRDALRSDAARHPARAPWLEAALRGGWSIDRLEELLWSAAKERAPIRPPFDPDALAAALAAFPGEEARDGRLLADLKASGMHPRTASNMVDALADLAGYVERARRGGLPLFVQEAKDVLAKLREKLGPIAPRPGKAERVVTATLTIARAAPPFPAALAHALLGCVRDELARSKRASGRFDFDDMLSLVDDALRGPRGPALAEAMRQRWRFALIDEFQDTDETQWSIFRRAFFDRLPSRPDARTTLVLVGDPKQSIYRFRGADVETYLAASRAVLAGGGARVRLERNFRATAALVEATNLLFEQGAQEPIFQVAPRRGSRGRVRPGPLRPAEPRARRRGRRSARARLRDALRPDPHDGGARGVDRPRGEGGGRPRAPLAPRRAAARVPRRLRPHPHRTGGPRGRPGAPRRGRAARLLQGGRPLPDRGSAGAPHAPRGDRRSRRPGAPHRRVAHAVLRAPARRGGARAGAAADAPAPRAPPRVEGARRRARVRPPLPEHRGRLGGRAPRDLLRRRRAGADELPAPGRAPRRARAAAAARRCATSCPSSRASSPRLACRSTSRATSSVARATGAPCRS